MSLPRREFLEPFTPEILSDLRRAARHLMAQVCNHEPEECGCELNRFTPAEFVDWLEIESERERGKPLHLRPAGEPNRRRDGELRLNLAAAS